MDIYFNMNKIKYKTLNDLLVYNCKELKKDTPIDLFFNLEMLFRELESSYTLGYFKISTKEKHYDLISNIFNLAAHYRAFFKRNGHKSRIFFYYSLPKNKHSFYDNQIVNKDYRKNYIKRFIRGEDCDIFLDTLYESINYTKEIFNYIEGVYLIDSGSKEPSLVPYIISKVNDNKGIKLVLTNDQYDMQYVNHNMYCIKVMKGDSSYMITEDNLITYLRIQNKVYREDSCLVGSKQYPFILSVIGDKKRNIPKLTGMGVASIIKVLDKKIQNDEITSNTDNIELLIRDYDEGKQKIILENYKVIDIEVQYNAMKEYNNLLISNQLIDKRDIDSLKELANNYMRGFPLQLDNII